MHVDFTDAPPEMLRIAIERTPHLVAPLTAARDHGCRFVVVAQGKRGFRITDGPPAIVIIGDDMAAALGPSAFNERSLERYFRTCHYAAFVACRAEPIVYAAAATYAVERRKNVAIIETLPSRLDEWVLAVEAAKPGIKMLIADVKPDTAH